MSKRVFVGGLSWGTDSAALRAAFETYGEVEDAHVVTDRDTGRSRGFGFVTFSTSESATEAIDAMNDAELDGRRLTVNEAREREPRRGGGGGGGPRGGFGGRGGFEDRGGGGGGDFRTPDRRPRRNGGGGGGGRGGGGGGRGGFGGGGGGGRGGYGDY
jgi:cold-inducible RNA-binding protein